MMLGFTAFSANLPANTPWLATGCFINATGERGFQSSGKQSAVRWTMVQDRRLAECGMDSVRWI